MSLHDRIMGLLFDRPQMPELKGYNEGIKRAARAAKEADELMAEMANTLCGLDPGQLTPDQQDSLSRVLAKYNDYKGQAK